MTKTQELERLRDLFNHDPFCERLGMEIIELQKGYAKVRMKLDPSHLNFNKFVHGGVIFTLLDQAFAAASNSHNESSVAVSMDVQFVNAPAPQGMLFAEAREAEKSRKLGLYEMTVQDQSGRLICKSHGRVYRIGKPILE